MTLDDGIEFLEKICAGHGNLKSCSLLIEKEDKSVKLEGLLSRDFPSIIGFDIKAFHQMLVDTKLRLENGGRETPKAGQYWRHFKGTTYLIITVAEHTESGETFVVYARPNECKVYARPLKMFMSKTDIGKYPEAKQEYRFEKVD